MAAFLETPVSALVEAKAFERVGGSETTFDPKTPHEWSELRKEAHQMLDGMLGELENLRDSACWQPMPEPVRASLAQAPLPDNGQPLAKTYERFVADIVPYVSANRHPRAWGWVRGQGTPVAMMADMLASGLNAHVGSGATAPVMIEETVLRWLAESLDLPLNSSGILTSGATMANLLGLSVARHAKAGFDVREEGLSGQPRMVLYCSDQVHGWAAKAVEMLGHGRKSLRVIPVDDAYQMDVSALRAQIAADRAEGCKPIAVVATAGTVNTGAFDNLRAIREVCNQENLWMHVDGAFGALLKLTSAYRALVEGLEQADSVAFDLHKWMGMPFETGCLLVRDREAHEATFRTELAYMERAQRGMYAEGWVSFSDRGIESSRGFKALRVWMQLSTLGFRKHGDVIRQNVEQAEFLEALIGEHPRLALLASRAANVVCFGYAGSDSPTERNAVNREVVLRVQESGRFVVSGTTLRDGVYAIRVAIANHRSRFEDFAALVDAVVRCGDGIAAGEKVEI